MRAVGISQTGGPEVVQVIERAERAPGPGEVVIAVRAAAVNPTDIGLRTGGGRDLPAPWTPGMDAAGVVEAVGEGVDRLAVGEPVMAVVTPFRPEGGAQVERLVVAAESVVAAPRGVPLERAATLPMNGLTALLGLELLGLPAGSTLAVSGGAGLLASYVIPLAKSRGLRVVADGRPGDADRLRGLGADEIVARSDDFGDAVRRACPGGVDGLFDTAVLRERAYGALRDGGIAVDVRGWAPESVERGISVTQVFVFRALGRTDWLDELSRLAAEGRLPLHEVREFRPEDAGEAQALLEAGGLRIRPVISFASGGPNAKTQEG